MPSFRPRPVIAALVTLFLLAGCADLEPPDLGDGDAPGTPPVSEGSEPDVEVPGIAEFEPRSLDGGGNNVDNPQLGQVGGNYRRVGTAAYGDAGAPLELPADPRYISNRIYNDTHQNLFSPRGVTQWAWLWGQFIDHTIGLRDGEGDDAGLPFDAADPLEEFTNDGEMPFRRSALVTGGGGAFDQANLVSSFIDGFNVYGGSEERLEWLRDGPVDGDLSNNAATMLSTDEGYPAHRRRASRRRGAHHGARGPPGQLTAQRGDRR